MATRNPIEDSRTVHRTRPARIRLLPPGELRLWPAILAGLLALQLSGCRQTPQVAADTQADEPAGADSGAPAVQLPVLPLERVAAIIREQLRTAGDTVRALYDEGLAPIWIDASGRPSAPAMQALDAVRGADRDGLPPARYHVAALDSLARILAVDGVRDPQAAGRFDATLSRALLPFIRDLHLGRIDPRRLGLKLDLPADPHDFPALIRSALADGRMTEMIAAQRPPLALYRRLQDARERYRVLQDSIAGALPPLRASIKPEQPWEGLSALHQRLRLFGDLPAGAPAPGDDARYEGALVDGVRRFQERHGLDADGIIGRATLAALNVPVQRRVQQIELSLERLRWLPDLRGRRLIAVNIPTFHLWAWDAIDAAGVPATDMAVIVGKALDTRTPVFEEELEYVIFRPYWNVPHSITRNELLPLIRRDPGYLQRNDMEIVLGPGDDARPVAPSPANLDLLAAGQLRLRQRPGPRNALGLIKFMFPNDANVYLHDTPADQLFSRARRDFSHGCVRVADPVGLAEFVLQDLTGWDRARILETMNGGTTQRIDLPQPITLLLFYTTAVVTPDGTVQFAADIYGHDDRLLNALAR